MNSRKGRMFEASISAMPEAKIIWTIGHSTRSQEDFLLLLQSFEIKVVADVRNYPGSKRFPHFNKEAMENWLPANNLRYVHFKELGGRRKAEVHSKNTAWKNSAFRGYADYMETDDFKSSLKKLEALATNDKTVYMCSEAVWWSCHRALISDALKVKGWNVMHIMDVLKATEHPYTRPARVVNGVLRYDTPELFNDPD
jgi:uncharacterized protein (DUF488 family)